MKWIFAFVIIVLFASQAKAWDCKRLTSQELFEDSEVVFIGKIIQGDSSSYRVIVQEVFKGALPDIVVGKLWVEPYGSSIRPEWGEIWLIYGYYDNGILFSDVCSGSRNFHDPFGFQSNSFLPVPPPIGMDDVGELTLFESIEHVKGLNELYSDIITLRQWKMENDIKSLKKEDIDYSGKLNLIIAIQGLTFVLLFFLVIKRKMN